MQRKAKLIVILLIAFLANSGFAQQSNTKILMDIVVVEMPIADFMLLQKQSFFWQNNPQQLIRLIENKYNEDKTTISIIRSQLIANNNETIVIVGNAQAVNTDKRSINATHTLKVTPNILTYNQINLLLQDQKSANNKAVTGGLAFEKMSSEQIVITNKALTLIAIAKLPNTRQLIFITPTIKYENN